jgi:hypothetical protein
VEDAQPPAKLSRLDVGMLITLVSVAIGGVVGLIAVLDADSEIGAFGIAVGVTFLILQGGATIACGLACLARRRVEIVALGGLTVAGLAIALFALAVWLEIDSETYGKIAGVAYVWSFFALVVLALTLATQPVDPLARALYLGTVGASLLGGLIATALILSAGGGDLAPTAGPFPYGALGNDDLLRPLGAVLVVIATLWFGCLAASRVERAGPDLTR